MGPLESDEETPNDRLIFSKLEKPREKAFINSTFTHTPPRSIPLSGGDQNISPDDDHARTFITQKENEEEGKSSAMRKKNPDLIQKSSTKRIGAKREKRHCRELWR